VKQPQFTQKKFKFEYFFKAQLYCHSLFAEIFVTVMVALLALETLHEATPIESNSICFSLSATQGSQGKGCHGHLHKKLCKFKYCSKAHEHWHIFCRNICDNDGGFTCPGHHE
jgi:hypothetical protein